MTSKTVSKTSKTSKPVVTGTVISKDAVVFVAPQSARAKTEAATANVATIRDLIKSRSGVEGRLLARLVFALILNPVTSTDERGNTVDALTALGKGQGAVEGITSKDLSYARTAHRLVTVAGIKDTEDERWTVALRAASIRGKGAVEAMLDQRKSPQAKRALAERVLGEIAATKGAERDAAIRKAMPSVKDPNETGSRAHRAASRAVDALNKAIAMRDEEGKSGTALTNDERAELAATLRGMADSLR